MIKLVALLCLVMLALFVLSALLWILLYALGNRPVYVIGDEVVWKFTTKENHEH